MAQMNTDLLPIFFVSVNSVPSVDFFFFGPAAARFGDEREGFTISRAPHPAVLPGWSQGAGF